MNQPLARSSATNTGNGRPLESSSGLSSNCASLSLSVCSSDSSYLLINVTRRGPLSSAAYIGASRHTSPAIKNSLVAIYTQNAGLKITFGMREAVICVCDKGGFFIDEQFQPASLFALLGNLLMRVSDSFKIEVPFRFCVVGKSLGFAHNCI